LPLLRIISAISTPEVSEGPDEVPSETCKVCHDFHTIKQKGNIDNDLGF
jgi:hypothetical protein